MPAPPADARMQRRALLRRLRFYQLRLWLEGLLRSSMLGLCIGFAIALGGAIALVVQEGVVERITLMLVVVGCLLIGLFIGLIRPPGLLRTARTLDARYRLDDRVGTAVELLKTSSAGRFLDAVVEDAATAIRQMRGRWPLPTSLVWRESVTAGLLALALLGVLQLEGQGQVLLNRMPLSPVEQLKPLEERQVLAEVPGEANPASQAGSVETARESAGLRTLDELRRARESGTLTPAEADRLLQQAESELGNQIAQSRDEREALERLARALSATSAGDEAAESLQRGDLNQAAEELRELGQESDQLSPEAKAQLAQALRRAAAESSNRPALAERERRAAEALTGRDYEQARAALEALGAELSRPGQAPNPGELAQLMEQLQQQRSAGNSGKQSDGQPGQAQGSTEGDQKGQPGGSQAGTGEGTGRSDSASGAASGPGTADDANQSGSTASNAPGNPLDLGGPLPRLDESGQQLEVRARPGSGEPGAQTDDPTGDQQPGEDSGARFDVDKPSLPVQAGGPGERIVVPGDQRQVVRDYFANRGGKVAP